jgi:hypothetical protein
MVRREKHLFILQPFGEPHSLEVTMNMTELYVHEVGRRLPEDQRHDIEKEIRTLVEDTLEDESRKTGRPIDESMTSDVLKRMGPPEKIASGYMPPRYLIGPELYPAFVKTLGMVLGITVVVAAIVQGIALGLAGANMTVGEVIVQVIGGIFNAAFIAAGVVVILFAIMQYAGAARMASEEKEWDPRTMRLEPDHRRVSIADSVVTIVLNIILLLVLNLYPQWLGFSTLRDGAWAHAPIFNETFFGYLPWLSGLLILDILLHAWLLVKGRWSSGAIWAGVTLNLLTVTLAAIMLTGPSFIALDTNAMQAMGWDLAAQTVATLARALEIGSRLALGLWIAYALIDAGKLVLMYFRDRLPEQVVARE